MRGTHSVILQSIVEFARAEQNKHVTHGMIGSWFIGALLDVWCAHESNVLRAWLTIRARRRSVSQKSPQLPFRCAWRRSAITAYRGRSSWMSPYAGRSWTLPLRSGHASSVAAVLYANANAALRIAAGGPPRATATSARSVTTWSARAAAGTCGLPEFVEFVAKLDEDN